MDNFDLKKFLVENKVTTNSKMLNENEGIKINFLKQSEWNELNDEYDRTGGGMKISPTDDLLYNAGIWKDEGYLDETFSSLEDFAKFITQQEGGTVEKNLSFINKMLKLGIISVN
jgi:hypothetical protein